MLQTNLILTRSHLDFEWLESTLAYNFLKHGQLVNKDFLDDKSRNPETLDQVFLHGQEQGLVLKPKISSKEDFRDILMTFYTNYSKPTLLLLGSLDKFSLPLQEGLLRILEEPPANLYIVLFAQSRVVALPTIYSRCKVSVLPINLILKHLDQNMIDTLKSKGCNPKDSVKKLLAGQKIWENVDLAKLERDEIDFWLWQILAYLEVFYGKDAQLKIANLIYKVSTARSLNLQNVQKKLALSF